jgi:protein-tyrosine-phosphatase
MVIDWHATRERAAVHAALAEPARLAIVDQLVTGDRSPGELGQSLGLTSNLLAHHLGVLAAAGLVNRSRSEADRRRSYVQLLPAALASLAPSAALTAARVVFVCTRNSARSQLAAALWARRSQVPCASAGTEPARRIDRRAVAVAHRFALSLEGAGTAHVDEVVEPGDLTVAVCDGAHERLASRADRLHWCVADPVRVGTADAFERAFHDIEARVHRLAPLVRADDGPRALSHARRRT